MTYLRALRSGQKDHAAYLIMRSASNTEKIKKKVKTKTGYSSEETGRVIKRRTGVKENVKKNHKHCF